MNNKLSLKNINVKYGESLALKSINLDIYKGEFVVLLGSSGAGKSTLLRTINQLNPLTSGAALATIVGVLVEVPLMLYLVNISKSSKKLFIK